LDKAYKSKQRDEDEWERWVFEIENKK